MADDKPNPYIRTYAKDVAALSGKQPGSYGDGPKPGVGAADFTADEREAVLARLRNRAAKPPTSEGTLLPRSMPQPVPQAASTDEELPAAPAPIPQPIPKPVPPPPPPRLEPKPITPPIPAPKPIPVPVPPPAPRPVPIPPPPPKPVAPPEPTPSPLHTYTSDFADRIDTKQASAFSVLAAQSDAAPAPTPQIKERKGIPRGVVITAAGIVLILLGGGAVFGVYQYMSTHRAALPQQLAGSLVFADERQEIKGEGSQLLQAFAAAADNPLPEGHVRVLYLTQASTTANGGAVDVPLSGGRLIGALQLTAPDILLRNIASESTAGIVHAGSETRGFLILRVLSYERTFAGMLQWEGTMESALAELYPLYPAPAQPAPTVVATTKIVNGKQVVSTTTVQTTAPIVAAPHFIDEVTSNHDVRALKDGQGRTILLYGYKDKETLIIARDEAAFAELTNRLSSTKQQ